MVILVATSLFLFEVLTQVKLDKGGYGETRLYGIKERPDIVNERLK